MSARSTRAGEWLLPATALVVWLAAVAWPLACAIELIAGGLRDDGASAAAPGGTPATIHELPELLRTSVGWAVAVAIGAVVLGWAPGRLLGAAVQRRGFIALAALALVPICLPSYVVFYAWWQSWPPDAAVHRWIVEQGWMQRAREATLYAGLVCWSWPLATLCIAGVAARRPRQRDEMLLVDGAPRLVRAIDKVRTDAPGALMGMLLVALATLNNTTCFDLAEVFTFSNEMRARAALRVPPGEILAAGAPMIALAAAAALALWGFLGRRASTLPWHSATASRASASISAAVWAASVIVPLALFWRGMVSSGGGSMTEALEEFRLLYASNAWSTLALAACSGATAMLAGIGLAACWHSDRPAVRIFAHIASMTWLLWALTPGTIVGLAMEAAYNRGALAAVIYQSPIILVLAHLAGAGFVAALLARWSVASEPRSQHDLRRLDGALGPVALWRSARPALLATAVAAFAIVTALAMGEIAITAQVAPPMTIESRPLSLILLNDMHYQRPQAVLVATLALGAVAIVAALVTAALWRLVIFNRRLPHARIVASGLLIVMASGLAACTPQNPDDLPPLRAKLAFGSPGQNLGQFGYPRALAVDQTNQWLYVIDKSARVQRFGFDGEPQAQWNMPEKENGKPTGVSVGPDGLVYVADTHYFRVMVYDAKGNFVRSIGSYGEGPGQFIYVTDIAFGPDGTLYVAEYGGHDRVQVFSREGEYLFEFGSLGTGPGQFRRPQSLAFSRDGRELYIADACNHRIVVTDPRGQVLRMFGEAGREHGQLAYPYSIEVLPDNTLLVCEFGNNRLQRFDPHGKPLGMFGRIGRGRGELQYPWAVAAAHDRIFVLDSGNNRVQVMEMF